MDDQPPRIQVLGMNVTALSVGSAVEKLQEMVRTGRRAYVCVATVHTVMQTRRSDDVRAAVNAADLITSDGMPLVWLLRRAGHSEATRVYGPDLMLAAMEKLRASGAKHYLYGGADGVVNELQERLEAGIPGVKIVGSLTPPFARVDELATDAVADEINAAHPDVVWVGISTPKQELWMARMRDRLDAALLIGVGAAFDFHSGKVRQAPAWMQRSGLEWLFRLSQEPRRLWRRYLVDNSLFLLALARAAVAVRLPR